MIILREHIFCRKSLKGEAICGYCKAFRRIYAKNLPLKTGLIQVGIGWTFQDAKGIISLQALLALLPEGALIHCKYPHYTPSGRRTNKITQNLFAKTHGLDFVNI